MKRVLITGGAGFIGFHITRALAQDASNEIVCVDSLNGYYDVALKLARLRELGIETDPEDKKNTAHKTHKTYKKSEKYPNLCFLKMDLCGKAQSARLFKEGAFDYVLHLAAQPGVRYSLEKPHAYIDSNIRGFMNILEGCRENPVRHLIYASSSSVYGLGTNVPSGEAECVDYPASLYAATKKSNELMAHAYSHLFDIPCTGLRFFTVYGPWGRPDMAYFSFTKKIYAGKTIDIYNHGNLLRDFTYVDDVAGAIIAMMDRVPDPLKKSDTRSHARYAIYNVGNSSPVTLLEFVETLESLIGIRANKRMLPMQPGDVFETYADVERIGQLGAFHPSTRLADGLATFVDWYRSFYPREQAR